MAKTITRTINSTRIHVATIDKETREVVELPDVVIDGHIPADKFSKFTRDVVLGYDYESGMYEMNVDTFIANAVKLSDEEMLKREESIKKSKEKAIKKENK